MAADAALPLTMFDRQFVLYCDADGVLHCPQRCARPSFFSLTSSEIVDHFLMSVVLSQSVIVYVSVLLARQFSSVSVLWFQSLNCASEFRNIQVIYVGNLQVLQLTHYYKSEGSVHKLK